MIPEWLLKNEEYTPIKDKDTFINKSILSLFSLIARIRSPGTCLMSSRFLYFPLHCCSLF
jgi:cobalt/nickel transport system permease protein